MWKIILLIMMGLALVIAVALIPIEGEVLSDGPKPYWRGCITKLDYEFAP